MMTATVQVRMAMQERQKGRTREPAALRANLRSRHTVATYEQLGQLPAELRTRRTYRTPQDPLAADGPALERLLEQAPELEAGTLFAWLAEQRPGVYQDGQLRRLQRWVALWRLARYRMLHSCKEASR